MKNAAVQLGKVPPVCLACLFFIVLWPVAAAAQNKGYAVQIAAVRAEQSADEMKQGLRVRGLDAYWIKIEQVNRRAFYCVRVGKFATLGKAVAYAERLLASGLLEAYAVTTFASPSDATPPDTLQASLAVQEFIQQPPNNETGALLAAINARQWWLPPHRQSFVPAPALSKREMLVFALGRHEWRLSNDLNVVLVRGPSLSAAPIVNTPARSVGQVGNAGFAPPANPSLAEGGAMVRTGVPEINRRGSTPTAKHGISYAAPPRLQGRLEMANGQLVMKLRNLDQDRSFAGVARVTLNDERHSTELAPLQFNLPPDSEQAFPVNEAARDGDSWMLMVFDEGGAMRLLRGAALGQKTAEPQSTPASNAPNPPGLEVPPYVTGTYDATTNAAPGQAGWMPPSESPNPNPPSSTINAADAGNPTPNLPASPVTSDAAGQISVRPKLIAATAENITIEFDIAAPRPLSYISLTLLSGDYRDVRQALMSTPHGRVPFLVPAAQAAGAFSYEIKDEAGRVLVNGAGDFRQLGRSN